MKDTIYYLQADLVLDVLPFINEDSRFALKGGTAINFFVREIPRLSVDIDLAWLPITGRDTTLKEIDHALRDLGNKIESKVFRTAIESRHMSD